MLQPNDLITGEIQSLAFGGEGILRHEGFVVFIPFAAPGDLVKCRIRRVKKSYGYGDLVEILRPSLQREKPRCPYFGRCGGCQLQHISYEGQLEQKKVWVEDALLRIGKFTDIPVAPVIPATPHWVYRRHIDLHLQPTERGYIAGYIEVDNRSLIEVKQCVIFVPPENPLLSQVQEVVKQLKPTCPDPAKLTLLKENVLHFHFKELPSNAAEVIEKAQVRYPNWKAVILSSSTKTLTFGKQELACTIDGLTFQFSSTVFMQNHPEQSLNIYRKINELAKNAPKILDLYCGIGISSLLLAKQGSSVTGIEYNQKSIDCALRNARTNHISNAQFQKGAVEEVISTLAIPDFVILNPPREGLDPRVIDRLKIQRPEQIVYVSCMPATLARDLRLLDYQIALCQPYDMFPQTAHVETLMHLVRNS